MAKTFSLYYTKLPIRLQQEPLKSEDQSATVTGHIFISIKLSDEFTGDLGVRSALGWYSEAEYLVDAGRSDDRSTTLMYPINSAAAKVGLLKVITLSTNFFKVAFSIHNNLLFIFLYFTQHH